MKRCQICGQSLKGKSFAEHWFLGECKKEAYAESKKGTNNKDKTKKSQ